MTALSTLRFSGYTLRPAGEADRRLAEQWTALDSDHAGKIDPRFWLEQQPGVDSVVVEDSQGPVFFFKTRLLIDCGYLSRKRVVAQVFIQFMPCATEEDRERTRQALIEGTAWLAPVLEQSGAEEMFFDTRQPKLISFCQKRLGFIADMPIADFRHHYENAVNGVRDFTRLRRALQPRKRAEKMEGV
jgi:hypothetical protein